MRRSFYLMVWAVNEKYALDFFKRFGEDFKKDKKNKKKLEDYEEICGDYIITLDSRKGHPNRERMVQKAKVKRRYDEDKEEKKMIEVPAEEELDDKFKEIEKCVVGVYLPDSLEEFFKLSKRKTALIEVGEGRDAIRGTTITIKERKVKGEIKTEYYLKGPLLRRMRGALREEVPLDQVLRY